MTRRRLGPVLAAVGVVSATAFLAGPARDGSWLRLVAKPIPVLCLAAWVAQRGGGRSANAIRIGLLLSALGDVLLEYDPGYFLAGLGAFLLAHLAYTTGFLRESRRRAPLAALPFAAWGAMGFAAMRNGLGSMAIPVVIYLTAVCAMMWRAAARVGRDGRPQRPEWLALGGAVLFGLSDTLIGLDRFRAPIAGVRLPIVVLYWLAQLGIAASAVVRPLGTPTREATASDILPGKENA
jgi:alkenylglycerophosphocholine hydrolase